MNIELADLTSTKIYHLMTQTIIPRPIAWVLSENSDQSLNLAPFSYFNAVCSDPPLLMLSMGKKPNGSQKDTVANLQNDAFCVVHIANSEQFQKVTKTAASLEYGESEVEINKIPLLEHDNWPLKRIDACPIAFLCKVHKRTTIGNNSQQLIFVEATEVYIKDELVSVDGDRVTVDPAKVNPLARLGASLYASLGQVFSQARPK